MTNTYIFADEAGCFTFKRKQNVSRYFILCTITAKDLSIGYALNELRHDLIYKGTPVLDCFHATEDSQDVRNSVYDVLLKHDFTVQATICEKTKAQPRIRQNKAHFYKRPWYYHFQHGIKHRVTSETRLLVTAASVGSKKERSSFTTALDDVMAQTILRGEWAVDFRPAQCDPCLQAADYCAWAIQRKWERNDCRSYDLIKDRITREYDLWEHGRWHYY